MPQQPEQKGHTWTIIAVVLRGYAATIYPFMRRNLGRNHPGIFGFIGMLWIVLWVAYTRANGLLWLIPMFIAGQFFYWIGGKWKGLHSQYGGEPFLAMKLGFTNEAAAKRFGEPLISFVIGMLLVACGYDEGRYFIFGAAVLMANQGLIDRFDRQRIEDIQDGMIEGQYYAGRVLNRRRNHVRNYAWGGTRPSDAEARGQGIGPMSAGISRECACG